MMKEKQLVRKLTKEDLDKYKEVGYLTVKDLREFLKNNPDLSDDNLVMVERVENIYFEEHNWGVYKKDNHISHNAQLFNEKLDRGIYDDMDEYPLMTSEIKEKFSSEEIENLQSEYLPAWGIGRHFDEDNLVFIRLHY